MRNFGFLFTMAVVLGLILVIGYLSDVGMKVELGDIIVYIGLFFTFFMVILGSNEKNEERIRRVETVIIEGTDIKDLQEQISIKISSLRTENKYKLDVINVQLINDKQAMICYKK